MELFRNSEQRKYLGLQLISSRLYQNFVFVTHLLHKVQIFIATILHQISNNYIPVYRRHLKSSSKTMVLFFFWLFRNNWEYNPFSWSSSNICQITNLLEPAHSLLWSVTGSDWTHCARYGHLGFLDPPRNHPHRGNIQTTYIQIESVLLYNIW